VRAALLGRAFRPFHKPILPSHAFGAADPYPIRCSIAGPCKAAGIHKAFQNKRPMTICSPEDMAASHSRASKYLIVFTLI